MIKGTLRERKRDRRPKVFGFFVLLEDMAGHTHNARAESLRIWAMECDICKKKSDKVH